MKFNFTVKQKLIGLSLTGLAFILIVGGLGYRGAVGLSGAIDKILMNSDALANQLTADMMHDALRGDVLAALLASSKKDKAEEAKVKKDLEEHTANFRKSIKRLGNLELNNEIKRALAKVGPTMDSYLKSAEAMTALAFSDLNAANAKFPEFMTAFANIEKDMGALSDFIEASSNSSKDTAEKSAQTVQYAMAIVSLVAGVILLGIGLFIARDLLKQLGGEPAYAAAVARRVAEGDLTMVVETKANDKMSLLASMKDMTESLKTIVSDVRASSEAIGSGTKQIASGNADLSQRTEEQASSLEETASSMEELTSTVKQNAENAKQANQLALGASTVAVKGGAVVSQVVETMSSINESSKKIVDIIGVIDGIAFQTNILALNAAVEAARAGEQGRGFAVVASEVRNLAQRSAAAAKEIKALIGDSVDKVGAGTKLVDEAGKTMQEIVMSVKRVTDIMSEITAASQEQSAGIEQVNQAITQMDEVTQQNAALVEEAAAAAESMQEQAQNLEAVVAVFNVGKAVAPAAIGGAEVAERTEKPGRPPAERRGPNRAPNVARLRGKPAPTAPSAPRAKVAAGGGEEKWEEF